MSSNTINLNLKKINTTTDGNNTFNIDTDLNDNWDKIDLDSKVKDNKISILNGAGTVSEKANKSALDTTNTNVANLTTVVTSHTSDLTEMVIQKKLTALQLQDTKLRAGFYTNSSDGLLNANGTVFKAGHWHVQVSHHFDENGYGMQIATNLNDYSQSRYYRMANETSWNPWRKILDERDTKVIQDVGVYDLNNAVESSTIRSASFLNFPVGLVPDGQGICEVYKYNSGWGKQVFITPHADYTVERIRANNTWLTWHINFNSGNYGAIGYLANNFIMEASWANKVYHGGGTITVPTPTGAFAIGTQITFINWGGTFTFVPASGAYINSKDSKRIIDGDFSSATLIAMNENAWALIGALR